MDSRRFLIASCLVISTCLVGCSSMTQKKSGKKEGPFSSLQFWKKPYQQPQKVAVLWSHDVLTVPGKPPTRGFGGRMYFYNEKSQAIPVEGDLIVYGYDESKRVANQDNPQPDKTFKFTAEQFTEHYSESDLGASYSVWIPWDGAEGLQKEITLIPTFRSSKGEIVQGSATKVLLPGRKVSGGESAPAVQSVSFEERKIPTVTGTLPTGLQSESGFGTTTISLPPAVQQSLGGQASKNGAAQPNWGPKEQAAIEEARAKAVALMIQNQNNLAAGANATVIGAPQNANASPAHGFINLAKSHIPAAAPQRPTSGTLGTANFGTSTMNSSMNTNPNGSFGSSFPMNNLQNGNAQPQTSPLNTLTPTPSPSAQNAGAQNLGLPPGVELTPSTQWGGSQPAW